MKPLATIKLDGKDGRGALYWHAGSIWCREPDGSEHDTETPCCLRDAIKTIRSAWSHGWDLLLPDLTWIETISAIIQGYDLEADPMVVRAEIGKHHDMNRMCCADFIDAVKAAAEDQS